MDLVLLSEEEYNKMVWLIENPPEPSDYLKKSIQEYKASVEQANKD